MREGERIVPSSGSRSYDTCFPLIVYFIRHEKSGLSVLLYSRIGRSRLPLSLLCLQLLSVPLQYTD